MSINWWRVVHGIMNFMGAILRFFGRLLRDVWLDVWRKFRPLVIQGIQITLAGLVLLWLITNEPNLFAFLLQLGIVITLPFFFWKMIFPKKKKKRR